MWELDCEESWALKNRCFWTVVLEKTLESPLDCKEIQPIHSEGDQPWDFFGRTDAKAETPVLWPPHEKSWLIGKDSDAGRDWGQEEKGMDDRGWDGCMASLTQWMWVWVNSGSWIGQGGLVCCDSWGRKESDTTEQLIWTELNWTALNWNFRNMHACVLSGFSHFQVFVALWIIAHQAPLSLGFYRQEYYSRLLCPPPRDLPDAGSYAHLLLLLH